ncbi:MAG: biotin/lipoyl-containing protein [Nitrospirota bacterium]
MVRASKKDKEEDKNIERELHQIIELVNLANLEELEIREGKKRVRIKKRVIREKEELIPEISEEEEKTSTIDIDIYEKVISPLTGIFYRAPALDDEPYVEEGDIIETGKTLCLIEAMKLFNEIKSDIAGKIIKIMVKNGEQIKEGQILFLIELE